MRSPTISLKQKENMERYINAVIDLNHAIEALEQRPSDDLRLYGVKEAHTSLCEAYSYLFPK
jgi:hypothetical protein